MASYMFFEELFLQKVIIGEAISEDNKGNAVDAAKFYSKAIEYFVPAIYCEFSSCNVTPVVSIKTYRACFALLSVNPFMTNGTYVIPPSVVEGLKLMFNILYFFKCLFQMNEIKEKRIY